MNLADMPPRMRRAATVALARDLAVRAASAESPRSGRPKGGRVSDGTGTRPARYRCARCGALFSAWAPAQRHATDQRHPRIGIVL